jgi:peptidoglycan lytic transglycosylase D
MKSAKTIVLGLIAMICLVSVEQVSAQKLPTYQQLSPSERATFVSSKAREIASRLSDTDYLFTPDFETQIQETLESYLQRLSSDRRGGTSPRVIFERARLQAPIIIRVFKAQRVSPLIGLYLPWIESAYVNISTPTPAGSIGMFQFLPATGMRFGLTPDQLLDVEQSADAAARYIQLNLRTFAQDRMKEALALLAYNRGEQKVQSDVALLVNEQNKMCSICAITEQRDKLDATFKNESVHYVPLFFAAAIIGENPEAFGIASSPLSSFETVP